MARSRKKGSDPVSWITLANGAQATESRELIAQSLEWLSQNRELVTLTHKGYQSPRTLLLRVDVTGLQFDLPIDWPASHDSIQVLFRDEAHVWNQVRVKVLGAQGDILYTEFPSRLLRLQRRANYRVIAPLGSIAHFQSDHGVSQGVQIVDVSANGMLVCIDHPSPLADNDDLWDLELVFPGAEPGEQESLTIRRARVMRSDEQDNSKYFYGIRFLLERQEEEQQLLRYVRQRERELLRKSAGA